MEYCQNPKNIFDDLSDFYANDDEFEKLSLGEIEEIVPYQDQNVKNAHLNIFTNKNMLNPTDIRHQTQTSAKYAFL